MKKTINANDYSQIFPAGYCRMGDTDVTYYRTAGNRLWFDKKAIEFVLTGKNQHNLLGQYKDPKNHGKIFDTNQNEVVEIISKVGVHNYLKKARSVSEEARHTFYYALKGIEKPSEKTVSEPIQMTMFEPEKTEKVNPFVRISETNGLYSVDYTVGGNDVAEKRMQVASMLISVANSILTGNTKSIDFKEVA